MVDMGSVGEQSSQSSKWNLTGTSQFTDSTQDVVNGGHQLSELDEFVGRKIQALSDDRGGLADRVFLAALREFRASLISVYGIAAVASSSSPSSTAPQSSSQQEDSSNPAVRLTYRDLIANFSQIVESVARDDTAFPKTLAVNAFRGYLNEFVAAARQGQRDKDVDKENQAKSGKRRKERWKSKQSSKSNGQRGRETKRSKGQEEPLRHMGHEFVTLSSVITIPTACEV